MRRLIYCIFNSREDQEPAPLVGVGGEPLSLIANNGLIAAVSRLGHADLTPDISRLLTYRKVIESFHQKHTVIPMRYGCVLDGETEVIRLLEERRNEYKALLKELEGCVEMGIRVLNAECARPPRLSARDGGQGMRIAESEIQNPKCEDPHSMTSGRAFLAARKAHYAQEERFDKENSLIIERCRSAFAGLFVKCKTETHTFRTPQSAVRTPYSAFRNPMLLSLYFLVPRRSVDTFRRVFRHIDCGESVKLLLSGPWPPYNFVLAGRSKDRHDLPDSEYKEGVR